MVTLLLLKFTFSLWVLVFHRGPSGLEPGAAATSEAAHIPPYSGHIEDTPILTMLLITVPKRKSALLSTVLHSPLSAPLHTRLSEGAGPELEARVPRVERQR